MAIFVTDPFDVAPSAPRYTPLAWLAFALGLLVALLCAIQLVRSVQDWYRIQNDVAHARVAWEQAAQRHSRSLTTESPQETEAKLTLQRLLRLSWTGLFATLEAAGQRVEGRAAVTALSPVKLREGTIEVSITGLAVSPDHMLQYLRALEGQPQVHDIQLASQQPAAQGGIEVVRFQAILLWQPTAATPPAAVSDDRRQGR